MSNKTKLMRAGITGVTGVVGAGIAAAVIAGLALLPMPSYIGTAPSLTVAPAPTDQRRVCQGPLVQVMANSTDASTFLSSGTPTTETYSPSSKVTQNNLDAVDNMAPDSMGAPTVLEVPAEKDAAEQPLLAGNQYQQTSSDELSGLATAACSEPANDSWLVGGSTDLGRTTLLMLANPTGVTATVTFEIFGESGYIDAVSQEGIIVLPGEQRIVSLAAFAPDVVEPVVHVHSVGGQILASMQHSVTRKLQPSGVDWVSPGAGPNTSQVFPGVFLMGATKQDEDEHGAVQSDLEPTVRVLVPGTQDAEVNLKLISETGETQAITTRVRAQTTLQLPFTDVADGTYTVIVTSDQPVVAGVRTLQSATADPSTVNAQTAPQTSATPTPTPSATPGAPAAPVTPTEQPAIAPVPLAGGDFTWFSSSTRLTGDVALPIPAWLNPTLTLYNPGSKSITAVLSARGEADVTVTLDSAKMTTVPLRAGVRYSLAGAQGLLGGLTFVAQGLGSSIALNPANVLGSSLTIYPR
ncbi:DUF5719 family protein [Aurantimicrobium minutum]|uniref:DUF5719 family protein n=1 Tax=Aurantimicrobium minutum TaxID=708131 RepID=UPI0024735E63|nr:DUF5719 family protein [Aurantimicrobium minutum]